MSAGPPRQIFDRRALLLGGVQIAAGLGLAARMAWLSVAQGQRYATAAEENRVAMNWIVHRRGWIVDAHGAPLANNRPAYSVELIPSLAGDVEAALDRIATVIPIPPEERVRILAESRALRGPAAL
jgi:penicillin-binding protein 2